MTDISEAELKKIAKLSRIKIAKEDFTILQKQVGSIISWVGKLNEVNVDKIETVTNIHNASLTTSEDIVSDGNIADDVLKNSANALYGYYAVPKVIE